MSQRCHKLSVQVVWQLDAMLEKERLCVCACMCDFVFLRRILSSNRWSFSRSQFVIILMAQDGMNGEEVVLWFRTRVLKKLI